MARWICGAPETDERERCRRARAMKQEREQLLGRTRVRNVRYVCACRARIARYSREALLLRACHLRRDHILLLSDCALVRMDGGAAHPSYVYGAGHVVTCKRRNVSVVACGVCVSECLGPSRFVGSCRDVVRTRGDGTLRASVPVTRPPAAQRGLTRGCAAPLPCACLPCRAGVARARRDG
jgi:hypothetical protein